VTLVAVERSDDPQAGSITVDAFHPVTTTMRKGMEGLPMTGAVYLGVAFQSERHFIQLRMRSLQRTECIHERWPPFSPGRVSVSLDAQRESRVPLK
jgi:hypothetical protein